MDVACPNCATRFRIPDGAIGEGGRMVRCGKCQHTWRQEPPPAEPPTDEPAVAEEAPAAEPEPEEEQPIRPEVLAAGGEIDTPPPISGDLLSSQPDFSSKPQEKAKSGRGLATVLWLLLLVAVGGALAGAWYKRDWILANYPAAEPIYAKLGLLEAEGPPPLVIRDVKSVKRTVDGERRYIITGVIENTSGEPQEIPPMRGLILGEGGGELVRWDFDAGTANVSGTSSVTFETSVAAPEGAQNLNIDFVLEQR